MIIQLQFSSLKIIGLEVEIRISTHYFIVRKKAKEYELFIKHISTNLIITDPMTKALPTNQYKDHRDGLLNPFDV